MKQIPQKLLAPVASCILFALGFSSLSAENEPTDNTTGGATPLEINSSATGNIPNSNDIDYYVITNTEGYTAIEIVYEFNGSSPDTHRMRVLGPNGTAQLFNETTSTGINAFTTTYTIVDGPVDATYFIGVEEQSADGNKSYTLSVNGSFATIDLESKTVPNTGETYTIDVTSTVGWEVTDIPSWATILPTSGFGNEMLTVTVPENTLTPREATINIGGVFHMLMQEGIPSFTDNEPTDNTTDGATLIEINGSADGSISNSDRDYFLMKNSAGFASIDLSFSFTGSPLETVRFRVLGPNGTTELFNQLTDVQNFASYTIDNAVADAEYIICIEGNSADGTKSYSLSTTALTTTIDISSKTASSEAQSYVINLNSNTSWEVTGVPEWASVSPTSGSDSAIITMTLEANTTMTSRTATLDIGGQSHSLTQEGQNVAPPVFSLAALLEGTDLGNNAYFSSWFGIYFSTDNTSRWVFHNDLGWLYLSSDTVTEFWYYDHETSTFWYTTSTAYPSTYRNSNSTWYFFGERTESGDRLFFNFAPEINAFVTLGNIFQE